MYQVSAVVQQLHIYTILVQHIKFLYFSENSVVLCEGSVSFYSDQ
jgi:hypothetical protein